MIVLLMDKELEIRNFAFLQLVFPGYPQADSTSDSLHSLTSIDFRVILEKGSAQYVAILLTPSAQGIGKHHLNIPFKKRKILQFQEFQETEMLIGHFPYFGINGNMQQFEYHKFGEG